MEKVSSMDKQEQGQRKVLTESDIEDYLIDVVDTFEARYKALEAVTLKQIQDQNSKIDSLGCRLKDVEDKIETSKIEELDGSLNNLREEFDELRNRSVSPISSGCPGFVSISRFQSLNRPETSTTDAAESDVRSSTPVSSPIKKRTKLGFSRWKTPVAYKAPRLLEDLKDQRLCEKLKPHYDGKVAHAEKLEPVQLAFLMYFFEDCKDGKYSARSEVISELYTRGVEYGLWAYGWSPENIKGSFRDYLKEKVRNISKKKQQEAATSELIDRMVTAQKC